MAQALLFGAIAAIGVLLAAFHRAVRTPVGALALLIGIAVFAIRLQHAGPYAFPEKGNLLSGVLCLAVGLALVRPWLGEGRSAGAATRLVLLASPIVLFYGLYATLAELEEVVVLRAPDETGEIEDLRLWIVDAEGAQWVTMPRSKADAHGLTDARVELLRDGETRCVLARRSEDHDTVDRIFRLRHEKYAVQRLATALGIFGSSVGEDVVTLRLEACPR